MKNYYVIYPGTYAESIRFIVKANNKKEAKDIIWKNFFINENINAKEEGCDPYVKCQLEVYDIDNLIKDNYIQLW